MSETWPNSFDFRTDATCQRVFLPFIKVQMELLKEFDDKRPADRTYIFPEHAVRVAQSVKKTCLHIGLAKNIAENMYWAVLPHDIGKRMLPVDIWDSAEKPTGELKALRRTHTTLGAEIVQQDLYDTKHPFKDLMLNIMSQHHEQMDGNGPLEMPGENLSLPVRLAAIVEAYDGWSIPRPHFGDRDVSPPAVLKRMREEKAYMFDMELFESFAEVIMNDYNNEEQKTG